MIGARSRYEVLAPLGSGGMASVFVGRVRGAEGFSRLVALKRAHPNLRSDKALADGLKHEARIASRLHHANVVAVLDVEDVEGDVVLVLEYVEGCTLRDLTSKLEKLGERRPREIVRVILDAAAGLHAAHRATDEEGRPLGIVHRDVSPSNVLVGIDGVSRLSDFGIAKALLESEGRTETGILKGKAAYMAPEYVTSQKATASTDLFSLAVVAWEALAGARLFKGATDVETLMRIARCATRKLSSERPELAVLDPVLDRALSRSPSDRHASVEQFARELEAVARAEDLVASHAEVSTLVERVAGADVVERRRALSAPSGVRALPAVGRDDVRTVSASPSPVEAAAPVAEATVEDEPAMPPVVRISRRDRTSVPLLLASVLLVGATFAMVAGTSDASADAPAAPPAAAAPAGEALSSSTSSTGEPRPIASSEAVAPPPPPIVAPKPIVKASSRPSRTPPARAVLPKPSSLMPRKAPPNPYEEARGR